MASFDKNIQLSERFGAGSATGRGPGPREALLSYWRSKPTKTKTAGAAETTKIAFLNATPFPQTKSVCLLNSSSDPFPARKNFCVCEPFYISDLRITLVSDQRLPRRERPGYVQRMATNRPAAYARPWRNGCCMDNLTVID